LIKDKDPAVHWTAGFFIVPCAKAWRRCICSFVRQKLTLIIDTPPPAKSPVTAGEAAGPGEGSGLSSRPSPLSSRARHPCHYERGEAISLLGHTRIASSSHARDDGGSVPRIVLDEMSVSNERRLIRVMTIRWNGEPGTIVEL